MEKRITLKKAGITNKVSWYLLVYGSTAKKVGKVWEISKTGHSFVEKADYERMKVGDLVRLVD